MATDYEWVLEELHDGDVGEAHFGASLADVARHAPEYAEWRLGLVRDVTRSDGQLVDRQWAYMRPDGSLPDMFDGGAAIPKRLREELSISSAVNMLVP